MASQNIRRTTIFDLEEACFRQYRDAMTAAGKAQKIITDSEWHRNHTRNRDFALNCFDNNSSSFKKKSVSEIRQGLIKRINKENTELIRIYEMREMTEAVKESLRQSKAVTDESKKTLNNLIVIREEQSKKVEENEARIAELTAKQSTAQEQHSNIAKEILTAENYITQMAYQNQEQERERNHLLAQSQATAQRLDQLEQLLKKKKSKKSDKKDEQTKRKKK